MTQQDARERAWREWESILAEDHPRPIPYNYKRTWVAAWRAAQAQDEQRIAALVAEVEEVAADLFLLDLSRGHGVFVHTEFIVRLNNVRALAGQTQEAVS